MRGNRARFLDLAYTSASCSCYHFGFDRTHDVESCVEEGHADVHEGPANAS
jgi:hypothetical protein